MEKEAIKLKKQIDDEVDKRESMAKDYEKKIKDLED